MTAVAVAGAHHVTLGIDVGGTFTDVVLYDKTSRSWSVAKVPSTPADFADGFMSGIAKVLSALDLAGPAAIDRLVHGTTVATNAILERRGARLAILTTAGAEDVLVIGKSNRRRMYDLFMDPDEPLFLAPRRLIFGIEERLGAQGEVVVPLNEGQVQDLVANLVERSAIDALVVCYLHSYVNPAHEQRTAEIIRGSFPDLHVSVSSEVDPRFREYERLVVTAFNAYVAPGVTTYLRALEERLSVTGQPAQFQVSKSRGAICGVANALIRPVELVLSGPAAGAIAAARIGVAAGYPDCLGVDIGGTSADVSLIRNGTPVYASNGTVDGYPIRIPMTDVRTIGAGGGSIAWVDEGGALKVGPRSAGSDPGPACYGNGGTEPTVTDASLVLNYLSQESFAGDIRLNPALARQAIQRDIADPLGIDLLEAAHGIHRVINSRMAQLIRLMSIERGEDPRKLALVAFGGAGPVHASLLASEVGVTRVLIPVVPGVSSALGLIFADIEQEFAQTYRSPIEVAEPERMANILSGIDARCRRLMTIDGAPADGISVAHYAELRYVGQSHELEVALPLLLDVQAISAAGEAFHAAHEHVYGHADRSAAVEFVALRAVHRCAPSDEILTQEIAVQGQQLAGTQSSRGVCFNGRELVHTPVLHRSSLRPGDKLSGPAILEQADTTTVIHPGDVAEVHSTGMIIITCRPKLTDRP